MSETLPYLRQMWRRSGLYRVLLSAALIYTGLRILIQVGLLAWMMGVGSAEIQMPVDLKIYLDAAQRISLQQNLYPQGLDKIEVFQYAPTFALLFVPFTWLPPAVTVGLHTVLHFVAYAALYGRWARILDKYKMERASMFLAWTLPVWLLFSSFWTDLGYLNIYIIIALLATFLIEAIMDQQLSRSLLWLSIILPIKPHWAFAAAVPLLVGKRRFFWRLAGWAALIYLGVVATTVLTVGPAYGIRQYADYGRFLLGMRAYFPWRGPDAPFLGYNHSITQVVVYLGGVSSTMFGAATIIKVVLLAPLLVIAVRRLVRPQADPNPVAWLDLAFALYLGVFIWLDMVWELSLGVALFPYLLGTTQNKWTRIGISVPFLCYALLDPWRIGGFLAYVLGVEIVDPGLYLLTDPAIYVPLVMMVILTWYAVLIKRMWKECVTER